MAERQPASRLAAARCVVGLLAAGAVLQSWRTLPSDAWAEAALYSAVGLACAFDAWRALLRLVEGPPSA